jgi:hypothetical protein
MPITREDSTGAYLTPCCPIGPILSTVPRRAGSGLYLWLGDSNEVGVRPLLRKPARLRSPLILSPV